MSREDVLTLRYRDPVAYVDNRCSVRHGRFVSIHPREPRVIRVNIGGIVRCVHMRYAYRDWLCPV